MIKQTNAKYFPLDYIDKSHKKIEKVKACVGEWNDNERRL